MKAISVWKQNMKSIISNGRGHDVVIDLPIPKYGEDSGPTALELMIMTIPGCITTIFSMIANRRDVDFDELSCEVETIENIGSSIPTNIIGTLHVKSSNENEMHEIWKRNEKACPVVSIIKNSGIDVEIDLVFSQTTSTLKVEIP